MNESFGQKISPIIEEISFTISNFNYNKGIKPCYNKFDMFYASNIFMSVLMDKMWELQNFDKMSTNDRLNMAQKAGEELRKFIKTYANIDMYQLADELISSKAFDKL